MARNIQISNLKVKEELSAERPTVAMIFNAQMRAKVFLEMTFSKWF